jgi:hypothetical protein
MARMLTITGDDYKPPHNGFFLTDFEGVDLALVHFERIYSPELYDWHDQDAEGRKIDHSAIIRSLESAGNRYIRGYLNVVVAGGTLVGVTHENKDLDQDAFSFVGGRPLRDDEPSLGIFGSNCLTHELLHTFGVGHVADSSVTADQDRMAARNCGRPFRWVIHNMERYLAYDPQTVTCHPERNHTSSYGSTAAKELTADSCGRPSVYANDFYGSDHMDRKASAEGDLAYFPAQYDYMTESILACWVHQNFVAKKPPIPVITYPFARFISPGRNGTVAAGPDFRFRIKVYQYGRASLTSATFGVDDANTGGTPLIPQGQDTYEGSIDTTRWPDGYHDIAIYLRDDQGVQGYQALAIRINNGSPAGCMRFEACVDGQDRLEINNSVFTIHHGIGTQMGQHRDCQLLRSLDNPHQSLDGGNRGKFLLSQQEHAPAESGRLRVPISRLLSVRVVEGRDTVRLGADGSVTIDDKSLGANRYVLDLCSRSDGSLAE